MAGLGEQEKEPGDVARLVLSKRSPTFCSRYLRPLGLHQTPPPQAPGKLEGQAQDQAKGGGVLGGHADRQLLVSPTRWITYIVMHLHCTCLFLLNPFNQSTVYWFSGAVKPTCTPRVGVGQTEGKKEETGSTSPPIRTILEKEGRQGWRLQRGVLHIVP